VLRVVQTLLAAQVITRNDGRNDSRNDGRNDDALDNRRAAPATKQTPPAISASPKRS
jgi:hypothetical protein